MPVCDCPESASLAGRHPCTPFIEADLRAHVDRTGPQSLDAELRSPDQFVEREPDRHLVPFAVRALTAQKAPSAKTSPATSQISKVATTAPASRGAPFSLNLKVTWYSPAHSGM